jgi:hypothetical protein
MYSFILTIILLAAATLVATVGQQQAYAWVLTIDLSNAGDFGDETVCAGVTGRYGYYDSLCADNSPSASVVFDIPDDEIPVDTSYRVCSWSSGLIGNVFRDCNSFNHNNFESVELSQADLIK